MKAPRDRIVDVELIRVETAIRLGTLSVSEALDHAYTVGVEYERQEAMHRACAQYHEMHEYRLEASQRLGPPEPYRR